MKMRDGTLKKALETYNRYRSPLVTAKLLETGDDEFKVQFEGTFCRSCGMDEYFVDLVYELRSEGLEAELLGFHQIGTEKFVAKYKIE